mmetsp:Transcript_2655/g.3550  ORF Transcript_2655/g.3550 Transcript_2655/m.3550 type:complete len:297 (+) Transcript_2655:108-998(+)|eukprot:CAMPEP_0198136644 /NCGR_PEP_ID=MMETSP1443-20131203/274_1 /TAXON_ID=186043 /ORGANISM="Entomoneis sp., Strain CCMP2396" /LENGTH=296 /DNA_ID=CAMNT_0043797901 /DNA_START=82 /DNA_END=972 /DNA_ORIENTATION=+
MSRILISAISVLLLLGCALARTPLQNLQVTLRGKKYDINDVTTSGDLKEAMKEVSGNSKEHHVLFGGKRLTSSTILSEVGVEDGATLNMVPVLNKKKNKEKSPTVPDGVRTTTTTASTGETTDAMKDYLKNSGVDTNKIDELMKQLGGGGGGGDGQMPDIGALMKQMGMGGGGDGGMPDMGESLEMMNTMMNSPMFQEYMNNPEMLEQSRQMILNNPMLKGMMAGMPGMSDILEDPAAWREAMQAAATMYKSMDPEMLKSMMGGAMPPGGGMGGGGLFDGNMNPGASSALDELDED